MTDEELIEELQHLGIDRHSHKVVALLPLVQVAWADGTVQRAEADLIRKLAEQHGMDEGDGARILESWLAEAPTLDVMDRGRQVLLELAVRDGAELGASVGPETLEQVVDLCEQVARAAGGLFGILWTVDERERSAIAQIARALRQGA